MKKNKGKKRPIEEENGDQGRPAYHPGSTTQGGSNYGQGSYQLGKAANKQGSEMNRGVNYGNEHTDFGT